MLIPLPGGHFADPTTVAAVVNATNASERGVALILKEGSHRFPLFSVTRVETETEEQYSKVADEAVAEVAEAINAALAPKGVEEVPEDLRADARGVVLAALKAALPRVEFCYQNLKERAETYGPGNLTTLSAAQQDVVTVQKAITLLESTPPKP